MNRILFIILSGIANVAPIAICLVATLEHVKVNAIEDRMALGGSLYLAYVLSGAISVIALIGDVIVIWVSTEINVRKKWLWLVLLVVFNAAVMPLFWYRVIASSYQERPR